MTKSFNKIVILLVALLICLTFVFAACAGNEFTPVEPPKSGGEVDSNGGIAVVYDEWLYYVNGYTSSVNADNTYSDDVKDAPRVGSVVRIRIKEIETILAINDEKDLTTAKKKEKIEQAVRGQLKDDETQPIIGAETVIPKIFYSGNTTTTQFTGIYIFNERIYVTTPNDELTANGDPKTSELVLMSFDLSGGSSKVHYTFTDNTAQIWLDTLEDKLVATYLMGNVLHTLDVESGEDTVVTLEYGKIKHIDDTVSSVTWDKENKLIFFIDEMGSLCKMSQGATEYEVILDNDTYKDHGDHIEAGDKSYTIKFVNNATVYYTVAEGKGTDNVIMYWAKDSSNTGNIALPTDSVSARAWKEDKIIVSTTATSEQTYYGISIFEPDTENVGAYKETVVLDPGYNVDAVTINRIEGDLLYYTAKNISYVIDLNMVYEEGYNPEEGTARAKSLASTTGWAAPDFIDIKGEGDVVYHYIISAASGTVTLTKFDPTDLTGTPKSIALTLTAIPEE